MILTARVPVQEIKTGHYTTYITEAKNLECVYITREKISRTANRYSYIMHYARARNELIAYNNSKFDENLGRTNINRRANKNFNPKKLVFINNVCELKK